MDFVVHVEHARTRYIFLRNYLPLTVKAKHTKNGFRDSIQTSQISSRKIKSSGLKASFGMSLLVNVIFAFLAIIFVIPMPFELRFVLGAIILLISIGAKSWWALLGAVLIVTALLKSCPLYLPVRFSTNKDKTQ
jgi:hypothetical protein